MKKRREINIFSLSFLDLISGALGAVIILYVAIPKNIPKIEAPKIDEEKMALQKQKIEMEKKIEELQNQNTELLKQVTNKNELQKPEATQVVVEESKEESGTGPNLDVGFKFKGKEVVFLVDTSLSMLDEDRMGQVKAGLKMLLTSMPSEFKIEIIQYPLAQRAPFKTLFGSTMKANKINKTDAFDFIYRLRPHGATPTRDVLLFTLKNYETISDIVLLTDGVPTLHNSNKKDDIYDILSAVRELNKNKIQISTIGVGTNFLSDQTSDQFKFLSLLATETGGFFVGF
jgi:hypothetical protein